MLQTKALYNLLRFNAAEDPTVKAEAWALENLREWPLNKLFSRLGKLQISLDRDSFFRFAAECDSPESLTDLLLDENIVPNHDELYLILFELWRRILPDRQSLSIFCDELDDRIVRYDAGVLKSDEPIQDGLANLLEVLEEHVDSGMNPQKALQSLSDHCANDLVSFLYDYISTLLDEGNTLYASELLEDFAPYLEGLSFEFLSARLLSFTDTVSANRKLKSLLAQEPDLDLLFEILQLLVIKGEHDLFQSAIGKILPLIQSPDELHEMLDLAADYYHRLDKDALEQAVLRIKKENPPDLSAFKLLIYSKQTG